MEEEKDKQNGTNLFRRFIHSKEYLILSALLFYMIGFMITNLYLSAYGVINFDLIRARYVLSGLLFSVFVFLVIWPLYGFFVIYYKNEKKSILRQFAIIALYSFDRYLRLLFVFIAIIVFGSGQYSSITLFSNQSNTQSDFGLMFFTQIRTSLINIYGLLAVITITAILVYLFIFVIYPKTTWGKKQQRRIFLRKTLDYFKDRTHIKTFIKINALILGYIIVLAFVTSVIAIQGVENFNIFFPTVIDPSMFRFFYVAFLIYLLISAWFFYNLSIQTDSQSDTSTTASSNQDSNSTDPIDKHFGKLHVIAWSIIILVPIYTFNIYPAMPQQIGGGKFVEVELLTSEDISVYVSNIDNKTYLVDRYSNGGIFLFVDKNGEEQVMEISGSEINGIIHKPPVSTATPTITPSPQPTRTPRPQSTSSP